MIINWFIYFVTYFDMEFFGIFQRYPTDRAYFIAKEILMTERTYKKDLEVLNLVSLTYFLNAVYKYYVKKVIHGEVDLASILLFVDNGNCWLSISYSIRRKSHVKVKHSFHLNVLDYINNWTKTPLLQGTFYRLPRSKSRLDREPASSLVLLVPTNS